MQYVIYYWGAVKKFYGRALGIVAACNHAGAEYEGKDKPEAPEGVGFAVSHLNTCLLNIS